MKGNVVVLFASPKEIADRKLALFAWCEAEVGAYASKSAESAKDYAETVANFDRIEPDGSPLYVELAAKVAKVVSLHIERINLINQLLDGIAVKFEHERAEIDKIEARSARFFG